MHAVTHEQDNLRQQLWISILVVMPVYAEHVKDMC